MAMARLGVRCTSPPDRRAFALSALARAARRLERYSLGSQMQSEQPTRFAITSCYGSFAPIARPQRQPLVAISALSLPSFTRSTSVWITSRAVLSSDGGSLARCGVSPRAVSACVSVSCQLALSPAIASVSPLASPLVMANAQLVRLHYNAVYGDVAVNNIHVSDVRVDDWHRVMCIPRPLQVRPQSALHIADCAGRPRS